MTVKSYSVRSRLAHARARRVHSNLGGAVCAGCTGRCAGARRVRGSGARRWSTGRRGRTSDLSRVAKGISKPAAARTVASQWLHGVRCMKARGVTSVVRAALLAALDRDARALGHRPQPPRALRLSLDEVGHHHALEDLPLVGVVLAGLDALAALRGDGEVGGGAHAHPHERAPLAAVAQAEAHALGQVEHLQGMM